MLKIISITNRFPDVERTSFSGNVSLTDFDIVIVDPTDVVSSFPKSEVDSNNKRYISGSNAHVLLETIERRRSEFLALLNKGRIVITFLDPVFDVRLISQGFKRTIYLNNYSWLPEDYTIRFAGNIVNGTGTGLRLVQKNHFFCSILFCLSNRFEVHCLP